MVKIKAKDVRKRLRELDRTIEAYKKDHLKKIEITPNMKKNLKED